MVNELDLYTGTIVYKKIKFTFAFDKKELRLIPPENHKKTVEWEWGMKSIGPGIYTGRESVRIEDAFLIGKCNETKNSIVFFPREGSFLGFYSFIVIIPIVAYVICKKERDSVDRISFFCPEINYIHPVNQVVSFPLSYDKFTGNGIISVSTKNFDATTTAKEQFLFEEKQIVSYFGISRTVSSRIREPPLRADSCLFVEFEKTTDYGFVFRLWRIARAFIRFLCYRKNIYMTKIELAAPAGEGKHETFALMYMVEQNEKTELETLLKGRYITQAYIVGHEGEILTDIANNDLYLRHIPDTFHSGRHIDASRFVMITAAFEWEFHRLYPDGVVKSEDTIQAEECVAEWIQNAIDSSVGKQKKIYKFLKRLVKSDSLESEIIQMSKDFSGIIGPFGERLYNMNGFELNYPEMGQRLSSQRNHFAHGDLDKDFIGASLLDLVFMEYVIYALQLKYYGVSEKNIQRSINELFHLSFAI